MAQLSSKSRRDPAPPFEEYPLEEGSAGVLSVLQNMRLAEKDKLDKLEKSEKDIKYSHGLVMTDTTSAINEKRKKLAELKEKQTDLNPEQEQMRDDRDQSKIELAEDKKYVDDLQVQCDQKESDFEERQQTRVGEIEAIKKASEIMSSGAVATISLAFLMAS